MIGDAEESPADILREQYIIMAQNTHTPVTYWLEMPIPRFRKWITANNSIIERRKKELKK